MNPQPRQTRLSPCPHRTAGLVMALSASLWIAGLSLPLHAASANRSPAGTWKWNFTRQNGDTLNLSATLVLKGDQVTGTYVGPRGDRSPIKQGRFQNGRLTFTVARAFNGNSFTLKYSGKVTGNTVKGKIEFERDGETRSFDWSARREVVAADATGLWQWTITTPDGQTFEPKLRLKQDGQNLTGASIWGNNEMPVTQGTIKAGHVLVKVMSERDGRQVTTVFRGKLSGDKLAGTWTSDWSGQNRTRKWHATRVKD